MKGEFVCLLSFLSHFLRNPNRPIKVEEVLNTDKEAKRFKMVKWDPFDQNKFYLELGKHWKLYIIFLNNLIVDMIESNTLVSVKLSFILDMLPNLY